MAVANLVAKIISRSDGKSAVAAAAYRAGDKIADERYGRIQDYSRRHGVLHSEIMAPDETPAWMLDRAALWNGVEAAERRKDSQLARDVLLILPHEVTDEARLSLVRGFIKEHFVDEGMIADFAMHAPHPEGDDRNYHCHVMLTMRDIVGESFGQKNREWNDGELLKEWRMEFMRHVNAELDRQGIEARVDLRSLEAQGIDREPEPKQGPIATEMERNGRESHAGNDRRATKARNDERDQLHQIEKEAQAEIIDLEAERRQRQGSPAPGSAEELRRLQIIEREMAAKDQERRREAFEAEWRRQQRDEARQLAERQQQRAREEEEMARRRLDHAPSDSAGMVDRLSWQFNRAWGRFLDTLDPNRVREREERERQQAEERKKAREIREAREREILKEKQKETEKQARRELREREKVEKRALIEAQEHQYGLAQERDDIERDRSKAKDRGPEKDRGRERDDDDIDF